jgi:hypothetical protein
MSKQIIITLYKFSELSETAKQKAIEELGDINFDYNWWESTYEDAENVGLILTTFDLDRDRHAKGGFIKDAEYTQFKIVTEHGEHCETYKTAKNFTSERAKLDIANEDYESNLEDLEAQFLKDILEDYSIILQKESEYLQSKEAIIESIEANDYDFTEDGKLY